MKSVSLLFFLFISFSQFAQLGSGVFNYKATIMRPDTNLVARQWTVKLFTNDTLVRVETESGQFGTQVYIRHMTLEKAYLLLDIDGAKYAIQTDLNKKTVSDTAKSEYQFKRKLGHKKVAGYRCKKYLITDKGQTEGYFCYFTKKIPNKYLEVYSKIPGLALDYYLPSSDGPIHYELINFTPIELSYDLFGVPSDYKRVTFEQFIELFMGEEKKD